MSRYTVSRHARADLKGIYQYIAEHSVVAAGHLRELFFDTFELLSRQSLVGESCEDLLPGLRRFTVSNYVVFFVPITGGVRIVRVLHGARDVSSLF